nr:MAG TPA: prohead serine protease [Caudoviricetes sp.]
MRYMPIFGVNSENKLIDTNYYIEGYAARYEPYVLFNDGEYDYYEQFDRSCFANCDMTDVIFLYDHAGKVLARLSNDTLIVEPRDEGLFFAADLGKTEAARTLYDEICAGMVTKMSWRFAIGDYDFNPKTRTFTHHTVKKIYDVSAVSIPANNNTEINARTWADGVISLRARRDAELDLLKSKIKTKIKIGG